MPDTNPTLFPDEVPFFLYLCHPVFSTLCNRFISMASLPLGVQSRGALFIMQLYVTCTVSDRQNTTRCFDISETDCSSFYIQFDVRSFLISGVHSSIAALLHPVIFFLFACLQFDGNRMVPIKMINLLWMRINVSASNEYGWWRW